MNDDEKSLLSQKLDKHASDVYLHDSTGENSIENVVHLTHLPKIVAEIGSDWSNKSILEMGFGEGVISRALVGQGMKFELLEGSEELVAHAKTLYGNKLEVHHSLFEDFSPPRFDSVLALHVLEHVDDPKTIVKKMYSWLKPGGKAIVVVPNSESLHRRLAVALNLQTHLNTLSKRDKIVGHLEFFSK